MTSSFPGLKSGSASLLSALRQSLMCPKCEKGPDYGSLRLSDCGHSFCGVCAVAVRGCCPFCQVATNEGSWVPDRRWIAQWKGYQKLVLGLTGRLDPEDKIGGQPADMDANEKMFQEHLRGKAGSNKAVGTPTPEPKGPLRKKKASSTTPKSGQASPATSPLVEHNYSSPVSGVSGSGTGPPKTTVQPSPSGLPTKAKKKLSLPPPDGGHDGPLGKENRSSPTAARARKPPHPNIEKKNGKGETALHSACIKGLAGKVREYLALGADPNTQDHARLTPLHEACQKGHLEIVQILLEAKALPNVPAGQINSTPLHDAVALGHKAIVRILIESGADKEMRDSQGKLPIDLTLDPDMKEIIEMTGSHVSKAQLLETLKNRMMIKPVVYNMVFIGGGTEEHQVCRQAAKELGIKVSHTLTEAVTHLVICDGDKEFADPGEHLFYEAMLMGKWVVNLDWIKDSRREKEIQTELAYEFNGVRGKPEGGLVSARRNSAGKLPRLLDGCHIYLYGVFKDPYPDRETLARLLKAGGATMLNREPTPSNIPAQRPFPFHASRDSPLSACAHFIIYQEDVRVPQPKYDMAELKSLPVAWLWESIINFKLIDPVLFDSQQTCGY